MGRKRWGGEAGNETRGIVLRELEKEVKVQEGLFVLGDMRPDGQSIPPSLFFANPRC